MSLARTCEMCKYWCPIKYRPTHGECARIIDNANDPIYVLPVEGPTDAYWVYTSPDFGCNLWETK